MINEFNIKQAVKILESNGDNSRVNKVTRKKARTLLIKYANQLDQFSKLNPDSLSGQVTRALSDNYRNIANRRQVR